MGERERERRRVKVLRNRRERTRKNEQDVEAEALEPLDERHEARRAASSRLLDDKNENKEAEYKPKHVYHCKCVRKERGIVLGRLSCRGHRFRCVGVPLRPTSVKSVAQKRKNEETSRRWSRKPRDNERDAE